MRQAATATEYVRVAVAGVEDGAPADPTLGTNLEMAFPALDVDPVEADWHPATWELDSSTTPTTYYARVLVGPAGGDVDLAVGAYDVWVRWDDVPEHPAHKAPDPPLTIF